jgi:pimeloyl-ACP methyl ester carboxylesterase
VGASGSRLYVEKHGPADAPVLLFTHGWGMDLTFWDYAKHDLADRFRIVLWDLPGLGRSKPPAGGEISLANFAADLHGILESLERPAVLIGHSIGGMTMQTMVRDHPAALSRVAGVVLLNTTYTNPLKTMILGRLLVTIQKPLLEPLMHLAVWLSPLVWISKWQSYLSGSVHAGMRLGFGKYVTRTQLQHASLLATRSSPAIEAKGDLAMFHWDATSAMARFDKPVLVVGGDMDIVTKLEASEAITAQCPVAHLQVVEGVNHMGPMERSEIYNDAIAAFAVSVQRGARDLRPEARGAQPLSK